MSKPSHSVKNAYQECQWTETIMMLKVAKKSSSFTPFSWLINRMMPYCCQRLTVRVSVILGKEALMRKSCHKSCFDSDVQTVNGVEYARVMHFKTH